MRAALTPTHPYGCRRPLSSNEYYPCYNMPHVDLVTSPIEAVTPTGIRTAEGERSVDTIILATGFETTRYASVVDYTGRGGLSLNAAWGDGDRGETKTSRIDPAKKGSSIKIASSRREI